MTEEKELYVIPIWIDMGEPEHNFWGNLSFKTHLDEDEVEEKISQAEQDAKKEYGDAWSVDDICSIFLNYEEIESVDAKCVKDGGVLF